jgi:hypothetical protein
LVLFDGRGTSDAADSRYPQDLPLDSHGSVTIDTYKGSIHVTTWDRNEVDVSVRIEEDGDVFSQSIKRADVRFDASPRDVRMKSDSEWFFLDGVMPLYQYTIKMPRTASLRSRTTNPSDVTDRASDLQSTRTGLAPVAELPAGTANT